MQTINLNMIPGGVMPVINLTQFDEGRQFALKVYNGAEQYVFAGETVTISGRKPDDTAFSYSAADYVKGNPIVAVSGNTVTIRNALQMAILAGEVMTTLTITKSAAEVSTLNFKINVQANPLDGVDVSDTEIPGIVELASEQVEEAEAWAKGTKDGNPVTSSDPQYHNNAKYWSDRAAEYAVGALHYVGSVTFANIPTTGLSNGDVYNITNDFTTDNRFIEGAGIACKAGTDIAWVSSVSKWDLPVVATTTTVDSTMSTTSTNPLQNKVITNALAAGRISFGVDSQGRFGYKKDGADTVYPFKTAEINVSASDGNFTDVTPRPSAATDVTVVPAADLAGKTIKFVYILCKMYISGSNHYQMLIWDANDMWSYAYYKSMADYIGASGQTYYGNGQIGDAAGTNRSGIISVNTTNGIKIYDGPEFFTFAYYAVWVTE